MEVLVRTKVRLRKERKSKMKNKNYYNEKNLTLPVAP